MAEVTIQGLAKSFGPVRVLHGLDLEVADGSLVALLGPSGCGKTTLLRLIAGLETPDAGRVRFDAADVTGLPPERRRIGMMFQSYALLPHLTVAGNLRFPLRMQRMGDAAEQQRRVEEALRLVRLEALGERLPRQLSGGQQQRVALARALIAEPRVLLLDEPLSNLDAGLRQDMQVELLELHRRLGFTTVLVTHDQEEALSLADTVVLMRAGRIEQAAPPAELYARPASAYAAHFVGGANLLPVQVTRRRGGQATVRLPDGTGSEAACGPAVAEGEALLVLRPEELDIVPAGQGLGGRLGTVVFRGAAVRAVVEVGALPLTVVLPAHRAGVLAGQGRGAEVGLAWEPARAWVVPAEKV